MANINGNEIYFGIIGEIGGDSQPCGVGIPAANGLTVSVSGKATEAEEE